eukprot:TRINITY_DN7424_c0_g2_i1.p1 TRINITY_DN7424_c0_g2~~TRINITY_DN7424_c0_g2_i1.p1  ORF type:complete len:120 (-),score=25.57 TRINITY_DN7424_c0_g2_i1:379-738(-)
MCIRDSSPTTRALTRSDLHANTAQQCKMSQPRNAVSKGKEEDLSDLEYEEFDFAADDDDQTQFDIIETPTKPKRGETSNTVHSTTPTIFISSLLESPLSQQNTTPSKTPRNIGAKKSSF